MKELAQLNIFLQNIYLHACRRKRPPRPLHNGLHIGRRRPSVN